MRKASSPYKKLLTAKEGDVFVLKGEKFEAGIIPNFPMLGQEGIYLTSKDRKKDDAYEYIHVRNKQGAACMKRQELFDLLKSGNYTIS